MNMLARRLLGGGIATATVLGGLLAASTIVDAERGDKYRGEFNEYAAADGLGYDDISGYAQMKIEAAATKVEVELVGLTPGLVYSSHLHNGTCESGGGGHYQDVEGGAVDAVNEIWLSSFDIGFGIMQDEDALVASAKGKGNWIARTDSSDTNARSVVVHAPGGARIACADLTLVAAKSR